MPTPRELAREQMLRDIVRVGRAHLTTRSPSELSLRAVARDLGVVPSALYRYVRDRDALLTLLIVDAYDELGHEVERAVAETSRRAPRSRLLAACSALRRWALREPSRFALLYGTPVPGYSAPSDRTTEPGTRVVLALVGILEDAHRRKQLGELRLRMPRAVRADMESIRSEIGLDIPAEVVARGIGLWSALVGAVSFEVFDQYGPGTLSDPEAFFDLHLGGVVDGVLGH